MPGRRSTRSHCSEGLLGQKKYADAEPLLKAGYEGMKHRAAKIPPESKASLGEALDRLIEMSEVTGNSEHAKIWKAEKAKLDGDAKSKPAAKKK